MSDDLVEIIPDEQGEAMMVPAQFMRTDDGNASRLVHHFGDGIRYCRTTGRWYIYRKGAWRLDETGRILEAARKSIERMWPEIRAAEGDEQDELMKHLRRSQSRRALEDAVHLAGRRPEIAITPAQLDADPFLLNVENGTIDLRCGSLRPHSETDLITTQVPASYCPDATCPRWLRFLDEISCNDSDLIVFLQRLFGLCLSGYAGEHRLFVFFGRGRNGKGVVTRVLSALLPGMAKKVASDLLMAKQSPAHKSELANLWGCRVAITEETNQGQRLDEARVKELTGGGDLSANFMRQDHFDFKMTHKLIYCTNYLPEVQGQDEGLWERMTVVPFDWFCPPEQRDKDLFETLVKELPGILAWAIEGARCYFGEGGLGPLPDRIIEASASYRRDASPVQEWLSDCCELADDEEEKAGDLYKSFVRWNSANGVKNPPVQKAFALELKRLGFAQKRSKDGRFWVGLCLCDDACDAYSS